ncbi:hypothetical protein NA29_02265 [Pandoraea sputorum]|uniref:Uncharacterized protein n=2 Tax=Pandoraea sputorum TaxID=93222 RepID=A0A239SVZ9_9BURK|nr:hypothetical protein NA29_02265 [Pandoraea sputorum]SNU89617.1 Uncharacterised protein [Pandoraea sputorum]
MNHRAIFIIESGKALHLVRQHISERRRVAQQNGAMSAEIGATEISTSRDDGTVMSVRFGDKHHPDFTKPGRYGSRPKKRTEWAMRFEAQEGYDNPAYVIAQEFSIPLSVSYSLPDGGKGWECLGIPLRECGFLFFSAVGPYAMWVPDIPAVIADFEARGCAVDESLKSFSLSFVGCRRIEEEEWEILVAQHKLAEKRAVRVAQGGSCT